MLSVAQWLLRCNADSIPDTLALLEDVVHLFEGAVGSLRVEPVEAGDDSGVDHSEDYVGAVLDVCEGNRRNHYHWSVC